MPNWNENLLIIRGTKKQREEFKAKYCHIEHPEFSEHDILALSFDEIIPEPKTIDECPEKYIIHNKEEAVKKGLSWGENNERRWFNWYVWRNKHWGTKWDCVPVNSEETKTSLKLWFDTAWYPPVGIIERLIRDNYDLKISCIYNEPGMDIHGRISYLDFENSEEVIKEDK